MKYLGKIVHDKDLITKEYLDNLKQGAQLWVLNALTSTRLTLGSSDGVLCEPGFDFGDKVIPIATSDTLGVVKGSTEDTPNGVLIDSEGNLTVGKVEISKVFIPEGEELILDGGDHTSRT